jgi:hypothetical protein
MKRLRATISLKQLRTDPRHYVDLLNLGYEVSLTDHGRTLAVAETRQRPQPKRGTVGGLLDYMKHLPPLDKPVPDSNLTYKQKLAKHRAQDYQ